MRILLVLLTIVSTSLMDLWAQTTEEAQQESSRALAEIAFNEKEMLWRAQEGDRFPVEEEDDAFDDESLNREDFDEDHLYIQKINVVGYTVIQESEINSIIDPFMDQELTFKEIYKIAEAISDLYLGKGYVTSSAIIPEQDVSDGVLEIRVVEGYVGEIIVEGNERFKRELFERDLKGRMQGKVFNYSLLKKIIRTLNNHPEREVKSNLKPSLQPNTSDIVISVQEVSAKILQYDLSNTGTKSTGIKRHGLRLTKNNLLGLDELWMFKATVGKDMWGSSGMFLTPLKDNRTKLGYSFSQTQTWVRGEFADLDVRGFSRSQQIFLQRELISKENWDLQGTIGLAVKETSTKARGVATTHDDVTVLSTDLNLDRQFGKGRSFVNAGMDFGLSDFLGAASRDSSAFSRTGAESGFVKWRARVDHYEPLPWGQWMWHGKLKFQGTRDNLPSGEQFSLTGVNAVRGFSEGSFLGDRGIILSSEVFFPLPMIPSDLRIPFAERNLKSSLQSFVFGDYGVATLDHTTANGVEREEIKSVGFGLRLHLFKDVYSRIEVGYPIHESDRSFDNAKVHFMVQTELF